MHSIRVQQAANPHSARTLSPLGPFKLWNSSFVYMKSLYTYLVNIGHKLLRVVVIIGFYKTCLTSLLVNTVHCFAFLWYSCFSFSLLLVNSE